MEGFKDKVEEFLKSEMKKLEKERKKKLRKLKRFNI